MKILLFPILFVLLTQQAFSSNYENAYNEINDAPPGYFKEASCFKYYYITKNIPRAVRANDLLNSIAKRYLDSRGYSDTDIKIALFANDVALKTQIKEVMMGISFKVPLASRRLANMKKFCAGER